MVELTEPVNRPNPNRAWPVLLLAAPAFVAIWSGWVGLGGLAGFGVVHPLPGIFDEFKFNTAITLPIGMETYAAYALKVWLSGRVPERARRFARWSAIGSLALGALGQIAYHLMVAAGYTAAPWPIVIVVACIPVAVLGMGAALAHLLHDVAGDVGAQAAEREGAPRAERTAEPALASSEDEAAEEPTAKPNSVVPRIGFDEDQALRLVRPLVAAGVQAKGRPPGRHAVRTALRDKGIRVGMERTGELIERAESELAAEPQEVAQ